MAVINVNKSGVLIPDLEGLVVGADAAPQVYELVRKMNAKRREVNKDHETNVDAGKS